MEDLLVNTNFAQDGLEGWGAVQGPKASSTRSELAGGCAAALAPYPIHLGSDNLTFVRRANLIINGTLKNCVKPWQLCNDGDLWGLFADLVMQRGPNSIRVTWVKGHSKQTHIDRGITTPWRKRGNDRADKIASEKGHGAHPDGLHVLSEFLEERHKMYVELVHHIHKVIAQTFVEDQRLRKQAKDLKAPPLLQGRKDRRKLVAKLLFHPQPGDAIDLDMGPPPQAYPNNEQIHALYPLIWCYLATLKGQAANPQQPGMTWLELMMLYVIRGGIVDDAKKPSEHPALPRPNILPAIQLFKRVVKDVLASYGGPIAQCFFKPGKTATTDSNHGESPTTCHV